MMHEHRRLIRIQPQYPCQHAGGEGSGGADDSAAACRNLAAQDFLLKLPGINASNVRIVMSKVESLAALADMPQEELKTLLESEVNAKKLWEFLHHNPQTDGGKEAGEKRGAGGNKWR